MRKCSYLLLLAFASRSLATDQLPLIPGFTLNAMSCTLPLPVKVQGESMSEEVAPVVIYVPLADAPFPRSHPTKPIAGFPVSRPGYHVMESDLKYTSTIKLRDGRSRSVEIPVFALEADTIKGAPPIAAPQVEAAKP